MSWEEARREAGSKFGLADLVADHLERTHSPQDLEGFLHYSSDLSPDACERAIVLKRRRAPKRRLSIDEILRMKEGDILEDLIATAWERAGLVAGRQIRVRALRPSAWAWTGTADVLMTDGKLVEIKRTGFEFEDREDHAAILSTGHQHQASAYFWALKDTHGATSVSVFYKDAVGLLEVPLEPGKLLVPVEQIVALEERRARLLTATDLPPVPEREQVVKVWKRKAPLAEARLPRATKADGSGSWALCRYCPFRGVSCDPGEDSEPLTVSSDVIDRAVAEAESRWESGSTKTPQEIHVPNTGGVLPLAAADVRSTSSAAGLPLSPVPSPRPELPPSAGGDPDRVCRHACVGGCAICDRAKVST